MNVLVFLTAGHLAVGVGTSAGLCVFPENQKGGMICVGEIEGCKRDGEMDNYLLSG